MAVKSHGYFLILKTSMHISFSKHVELVSILEMISRNPYLAARLSGSQ